LSHLMDDTSSVASAKSSCRSGKKAPPDDVGGDTDEEVDLDFVVDDDDVGSMVEDYVEPAQHSSPLLQTNSFDKAVSTNMCKATKSFDDAVRTNICKETKSSGDETPYNRWLAGPRTSHLLNCLKFHVLR
jgi:hypothetical protein